MAKLSDQQIARHVIDGGFVGDERAVGVAIVLAESGGRTDAVGDVALETAKWGPSIGLFQIRSLRVDKGTGRTRDQLANFDPATNARHARTIFLEAGGRWTPWSTFLHNSHVGFMGRAREAVRAAGGGAGVTPTPQAGASTHVIRGGESLGGIAQAHGMSLDQLKALNPGLFDAAHKFGNLVHPGEIVQLAGPTLPLPPPAVVRTHVIRRGESLGGIAQAHGMSLNQLKALNPGLFDAAHKFGNLVHPGEVVRL